jgi:hypothetical protein
VFNKAKTKDGAKVDKGSAFPTCISLNQCARAQEREGALRCGAALRPGAPGAQGAASAAAQRARCVR